MKRNEKIIVLSLLIVFSLMFIIFRLNKKDSLIVSVKDVNKNVILSFDIYEDNYYELEGQYGKFCLEVKDGRCRATNVECPNQICVHTGWISADYPVPIVCLPNGLVVEIDEKY